MVEPEWGGPGRLKDLVCQCDDPAIGTLWCPSRKPGMGLVCSLQGGVFGKSLSFATRNVKFSSAPEVGSTYVHDQRVAIMVAESRGPALNCVITVSDTHGVRECEGVVTYIMSGRSGGHCP